MEKHQGLKDELEMMWKVKTEVIPEVVGALTTVTSKLESGSKRSQEQHQHSLSRRV